MSPPIPVTIQQKTKIYNVSGYDSGKLPEWLLQKHRRKLKKDPDYGRRVELIQEFEFPEASNIIKLSQNERFIVSTGVYKPQIRVFDLDDLTIKFERHTDAETLAMELLDEDWTKLLLLQSGKSVEFHTQGGIYYSSKIPLAGRDLYYDFYSCDALIGGNTSDICRLNLEQGKFLNPIQTDLRSLSKIDANPIHRLLAAGSSDSARVSYHDLRSKTQVGAIDLSSASFLDGEQVEISSLLFLPNGLHMAVGTSNGLVLMYDLRSMQPFSYRDHSYGFPIKSIKYHEEMKYILSADKKIVKIWDPNSEKANQTLLASVEPPHPINDLCLQQKTGFFMLANEGSQIQSFYIPTLGPAPKWCSFLDNLTEELEENPQPIVYDNYKFVTRTELANLGLEHLIGTNTLRAYMHGFFMDFRLYEKAKSIMNPFAYEEFRQKKIQEKLTKERASRIHTTLMDESMPKVNRSLAEKLMKKSSNKTGEDEATAMYMEDMPSKSKELIDERFKDVFQDEDFEVDENSREYQLLHPSEKKF